jgi:hypothetical protein
MSRICRIFKCSNHLLIALLAYSSVISAEEPPRINYLSLAQGAIPVSIGGASKALRVEMEQALQAIDGNDQPYSATPKPGNAETHISFIYELPALTTFTDFSVSNVLETPSPSQTFFSTIEIAGTDKAALSQRRAEAVVAAVAARGVEAARMSAMGQGEKHPIADNASDLGRSLNRRVKIDCR